MPPLKIAFASSEVAPFAKTGGLADVACGLARWLGSAGHDVRVFMPLYRSVREQHAEAVDAAVAGPTETMQFGARAFDYVARTGRLPDSEVPVEFIDCPLLFDRDDLYTDDADEHLRFAMFSRAVLERCQRLQWGPDVLHCNDWHTGLLPLYARSWYGWDRLFEGSKSVMTIHNIGYQGVFGADIVQDLALDEHRQWLHQNDLQQGHVGYLKTGLIWADALTTVSETYADEIQSPEFGMGLEDVLRARRDVLVGIVNGIDYGDWDPRVDPLITQRYEPGDFDGKLANKRALREDFGLDESDVPVLGIVSRLTGQKGFELLPDVLPVLLQRDAAQLVVLGSGEERYEQYFQWLRNTYPTKVAFYRGYNNELAHRIEAGADVFLMPSRYEPCGLNQMYSLRYGTAPVVRRTGGLADTVVPFDRATGEGNGFVFDEFSAEALYAAIGAALDLWRDQPAWRRMLENGMREDWSWARQGPRYVELYERLRGG